MITDGPSLTKANEGCRLAAYYDEEGQCWTIGYGHVGPDACHGTVWTQAQCDNQFAIDYARARAEAARALGQEWNTLDAPRQAVLADMGFQVGGAGLGKFVHLLDAMRAGNWALAGAALKNSALFREAPRREAINLRILLSGQWPDASPAARPVPAAPPAAPRSVALPPVPPCIPEPPRGLWGAILALLGRP